jgi:AcrR family transcriptional regulator
MMGFAYFFSSSAIALARARWPIPTPLLVARMIVGFVMSERLPILSGIEFNYLMTSLFHPTKIRLIETTAGLLENQFPEAIQVDEILEKSGISKGSLYHHFEDLSELLEAAQVARYALWVDRSIGLIVPILSEAKNRQDIIDGLRRITTYTQSTEYKATRFQRARTLANSETSARFQRALGLEQDRLTTALQDLVEEAKNKGLFRVHLDARVVAIFIQSYTLGKIVDDVVPSPMDQEKWDEFIMDMLVCTMVSE